MAGQSGWDTTTPDEIDDLARRAQDGDRDALEALLGAVRPRALNVCRGVLPYSADAEDATPIEDIGYADAIAELNEILADLEDDDLDIDVLGDRVARAATLIALCRDRIDVARLRVTEVVATLDGEPE